jgi:hypothetical protein
MISLIQASGIKFLHEMQAINSLVNTNQFIDTQRENIVTET